MRKCVAWKERQASTKLLQLGLSGKASHPIITDSALALALSDGQ